MPQGQQVSREAFDLLKEGQELQFQEPPEYVAAEEKFRKAIELATEWGEPYLWLGSVLSQQNKLNEACEAERIAIQLLPSDPRPLISLGWKLRLMEKYAEAVPYLEQGLSLKPYYGEADARLMLAEVYELLGKLDEASVLWRQIMGMDSMYPSYEYPMEEAERKLAKYGLTTGE